MKKNKSPLTSLWITIALFGLLYLGMIVYLFRANHGRQEELINNSFNSRQKLLSLENTRGTIFDRNGEAIAVTSIDNDGKEYRFYPKGDLYAHAVGYSTKGKTAVESIANYYLINSNIPLSQKVENEIQGKKNPGNDVYTTFDTRLQEFAYNSLGAFKGAIIISDVKTGEILAMVSKPDFDPNTIVEDWDKITSNMSSSVLLNRVTQGLYPPGSVFKIVTALEYIRENPDSYRDYIYSCSGHFRKDNIDIKCYHGTVHGEVGFAKSFAVSCNCSFTNMGLSLDRNRYGDTSLELLFNQNLPLDYNYSVSELWVDETASDEDMAQISFGQGQIIVTPMLINMITNAIANDGVLMKPKELIKATDANGNVINEWKNEEYRRLISKEEASVLKEIMQGVIKSGTANALKSPHYTVAGKTGSADFNDNERDSHAWFTGFAPVEDPEISVTIIVEEVGTGGQYAAPLARRLFDCYFGVQ